VVYRRDTQHRRLQRLCILKLDPSPVAVHNEAACRRFRGLRAAYIARTRVDRPVLGHCLWRSWHGRQPVRPVQHHALQLRFRPRKTKVRIELKHVQSYKQKVFDRVGCRHEHHHPSCGLACLRLVGCSHKRVQTGNELVGRRPPRLGSPLLRRPVPLFSFCGTPENPGPSGHYFLSAFRRLLAFLLASL
jgi:hypothetical protein